MKKLMALTAAFLCTAALVAADNLLKNGTLEQLADGGAAAWLTKAKSGITYSGEGAPEGGFVQFDLVRDGQDPSAYIWQDVSKVVQSGGKYTISFQLRTKNFKGKVRVILINDRWSRSVGLVLGGKKFPMDWKEYRKDVVMPEFKKDARLIVMVIAQQGIVEVADVKLVSAQEETK